MRSINSVTISGNLGKDPVIRSTPSGTEVLEMRVAVSDNVKRNGAWEKKTHWVHVALFGKRAEFFATRAKKGSFVVVSGRLNYEEWSTDDGHKRNRISVIADDIDIGPISIKPTSDGGRNTGAEVSLAQEDDEIPF